MADSEWIFASVINFLQSPLWATPVFTYVDQNCMYFDKEEENKLEYTKIHDVCLFFLIFIIIIIIFII